MQWIGKKNTKPVNNLTYKTKEGGWTCLLCGKVFRTRREKQAHLKEEHPDVAIRGGWNKGLTKETSPSLQRKSTTWKKNLRDGKFKPSFTGKKHTEETKRKISKARTEYLIKNPDKVPYVLNHHSRGESFPEKYFREWMDKEQIQYIQEYKFELYSFDFLVKGNIDLEIDGDQHILDEKYKEHDKKRDERSSNAGYTVKRIVLSEF